MLRRIGRFLWKAVKWAFLVVVALFALAVLINWRDESLSDEARSLLETKPVEVPDSENIFVALAGFNAPEGDDIFEVGRSHIKKIEKELEQDPSGRKIALGSLKKSEETKEQEERKALRWQNTEPPFDCQFDKDADFLKCAHDQKDRLEKTLEANKTLIRRYRFLQDLPHYVMSQTPDIWFAADGYQLTATIKKALAAQALLDIESGNVKAVKAGLTFFKKDMALWRRMLEGKSFLIDSMIATAQITRNIHELSLLLSSPSTDARKYAPEWREVLTPLSREQYSLRPAIGGEIRFVYNYLPVMKEGVSYQEAKDSCKFTKPYEDTCSVWQVWQAWLERNVWVLFFQPNASFNRDVSFYKTWLKLADLSWTDYIAQRDEVLAPLADFSKPGIDWIYNPIGKEVRGQYVYIWDEYVGRIHDLDAYLRLVRLQLELRLAKISSDEIPAFINQQNEAYCSPCSGFSWDAETRMLSFQPYNEKNFSRFSSSSVYVPETGKGKP
jgi:hypothetical protein